MERSDIFQSGGFQLTGRELERAKRCKYGGSFVSSKGRIGEETDSRKTVFCVEPKFPGQKWGLTRKTKLTLGYTKQHTYLLTYLLDAAESFLRS